MFSWNFHEYFWSTICQQFWKISWNFLLISHVAGDWTLWFNSVGISIWLCQVQNHHEHSDFIFPCHIQNRNAVSRFLIVNCRYKQLGKARIISFIVKHYRYRSSLDSWFIKINCHIMCWLSEAGPRTTLDINKTNSIMIFVPCCSWLRQYQTHHHCHLSQHYAVTFLPLDN